MTEKRLDDLIEKSSLEQISNEELLEVLAATLKSTSRHSKEIKQKLLSIENDLNEIKKKIEQPKFAINWGKIEDDEEEPDQD